MYKKGVSKIETSDYGAFRGAWGDQDFTEINKQCTPRVCREKRNNHEALRSPSPAGIDFGHN